MKNIVVFLVLCTMFLGIVGCSDINNEFKNIFSNPEDDQITSVGSEPDDEKEDDSDIKHTSQVILTISYVYKNCGPRRLPSRCSCGQTFPYYL